MSPWGTPCIILCVWIYCPWIPRKPLLAAEEALFQILVEWELSMPTKAVHGRRSQMPWTRQRCRSHPPNTKVVTYADDSNIVGSGKEIEPINNYLDMGQGQRNLRHHILGNRIISPQLLCTHMASPWAIASGLTCKQHRTRPSGSSQAAQKWHRPPPLRDQIHAIPITQRPNSCHSDNIL